MEHSLGSKCGKCQIFNWMADVLLFERQDSGGWSKTELGGGKLLASLLHVTVFGSDGVNN